MNQDARVEVFRRRFLSELLEACYRSRPREGEKQLDPREAYEFSVGPSWSKHPGRRLKSFVSDAIARAGFAQRHFGLAHATESLSETMATLEALERTHGWLGDEHSRQLLLDLLILRALGPKHASLPISAVDYWAGCASVERSMRVSGGDAIGAPALVGIPLHRYAVPGRNGRIELFSWAKLIVEIFRLEQYAYRRADTSVRAEPGDVVIDGGGWVGDTALYFADSVGTRGRVLCFEFVDRNLEVLERNLALNQRLTDTIEVVPRALWDSSGELLEYEPEGGVTQLGSGDARDPARVETETLDDFVLRTALDRVDFLKLDIEGAELHALRGAEGLLRRFRPKLAVAAYHRPDDLTAIPEYLHSLDLGYDFFLDHFSPTDLETVLFCRPRG